MNIQMMEGLLGASSNIKLSGTPMSVYRQASAEGDTEKMKRALGYTGECAEKAVKYQEKLDKGMNQDIWINFTGLFIVLSAANAIVGICKKKRERK